jgi:hypothetical protein
MQPPSSTIPHVIFRCRNSSDLLVLFFAEPFPPEVAILHILDHRQDGTVAKAVLQPGHIYCFLPIKKRVHHRLYSSDLSKVLMSSRSVNFSLSDSVMMCASCGIFNPETLMRELRRQPRQGP